MDEVAISLSHVDYQENYEIPIENEEAVNSDGNIVVVGCPGSGKTDVIGRRIGRVLKEGGSPLVIVRTRRAERELLKRFPDAYITTMHKLCAKFVSITGDFNQLLEDMDKKKKVPEGITDILVDEGQDLGRIYLDILLHIQGLNNANFFIVLDPFQSIYIGDWAGGYKGSALGEGVFEYLKESISINKTIHLRVNYRSNSQIIKSLDNIFNRDQVSRGPKLLETTAIFTRDNLKLKRISNLLVEKGFPHSLRQASDGKKEVTFFGENPKIHLMVYHACKGAQFKRTILFDWNENSEGLREDIYLLYVGLSRAAEEAYLISPTFYTKPMGRYYIPELIYKGNFLNLLEVQ